MQEEIVEEVGIPTKGEEMEDIDRLMEEKRNKFYQGKRRCEICDEFKSSLLPIMQRFICDECLNKKETEMILKKNELNEGIILLDIQIRDYMKIIQGDMDSLGVLIRHRKMLIDTLLGMEEKEVK